MTMNVTVHGRQYKKPTVPTVAICVDGFDPEYLNHGIEDGILPNLANIRKDGFCIISRCAMPSLTNPNNCSIITGQPTVAHGVSGNFFLDKETGEEIMIVDDTYLRGTTILEQMSKAGVRVAAVTAKHKLCQIIGHGLETANGAIHFSSQRANQTTPQVNGIENVEKWLGSPTPDQYSGELSLFVLRAGVKLLQEKRADLMYLTLSDVIQHHYAPQSKESNEFLRELDVQVGKLLAAGAIVALTGDHGMSDKAKADGSPNVLFLEDVLNQKFGSKVSRVICPITDPFVKHHGALGSFVRVHVKPGTDIGEMLTFIKQLPEVDVAYTGAEAAEVFQMPPDREGDIVVVSKKNVTIGSREDEHDLSQLAGHRLRSHGGLSEQEIPLMLSVPTKEPPEQGRQWRNFDIFELALNLADTRAVKAI